MRSMKKVSLKQRQTKILGDRVRMRTEIKMSLNIFPAALRNSHRKICRTFSFYCWSYSTFFAKLAEQILSNLFVFSKQLQMAKNAKILKRHNWKKYLLF